jgi:hypothetical protein
MHDTKKAIRRGYSWLCAAALATFLSSCLTIGETDGGPGVILDAALHDRLKTDLAPLYGDVGSPNYGRPHLNKVRFGYHGAICQQAIRLNCLAFKAGPEIEERLDVLRKLEELIRDPCQLLPSPQILAERLKLTPYSVHDARTKVASDYFECFKNVQERNARVIEFHTVADPVLPSAPTVLKARTYRVPMINLLQ